MKCSDCKYAIFEDVGYSNYTVEGSNFTCSKGNHPDGTFDRFYNAAKELSYAEKCNKFKIGEAIIIKVEKDNLDKLSQSQKAIYYNYKKEKEREKDYYGY
jgi:hypothetical protein